MKQKIIRITEADIHRMVKEAVKSVLKETDCASAMQDNGGNPSAGQYDVPFVSDKETEKRNEDFDNGSISMHRVGEGTDVISRPIYKM